MTKRDEISATMAAALALAFEHGGKLERRAGGFWTYAECPWAGSAPHEYFGTSTIEGLVKRGRMTYSQWKECRGSRFPIEATAIDWS